MTGSAAALQLARLLGELTELEQPKSEMDDLSVALEVSLAHERRHEARDRGLRQIGARRELGDAKPVVVLVERLEDRGHPVEDADRV